MDERSPTERVRAADRPAAGPTGRPHPWLALALVLLFVALAYGPALEGEPVWDDRSLLSRSDTRELQGLGHYFREPFWQRQDRPETFYRPLVSLTLALDHALWRGSAAGFHATNLLLHLGVCALVFALARRAGAGVIAAALAAAILGVLPRLTESVAWISGRSDLLSALTGLAAVWLHTRPSATTVSRAGAAFALLLALFSKENAIAAFAAIAAFEAAGWVRDRGPLRSAARHLLPCLCALLVYAVLRLGVVRDVGGDASLFSATTRLAMPFDVMGTLVTMLLDPLHPAARIGRVGIVEPLRVGLGFFGFAALAALLVRTWSKHSSRVTAAAAVFACVALLPVLQLIPPFSDVTASDRFLYLPAAGAGVILAAWGSALSTRSRRIAGALACTALALFSFALGDAIETWRSERGLWEKTLLSASPYDALPHAAMGNWFAEHHQPEQALAHYEAALESQTRYAERYPAAATDPQLLGALGITLSVLERYDEAIAQLERRAQLHPRLADSHLLLGVAQARAFHFDEAQHSFTRAEEMGARQAHELASQTHRAREIIEALSDAPGDEALSLALRARACALVGRLREAETLYARLLDEPRASDEEISQAAHFMVLRGDLVEARAALDTLASRERADPGELTALELRLSQRR